MTSPDHVPIPQALPQDGSSLAASVDTPTALVEVKLSTGGCIACGEKLAYSRLTPFCSVVCRILGTAGPGWRLNPYRIINLKTQAVVSSGPAFDVTPRGIAALKALAEREAASRLASPAYLPQGEK